MAKKEKSKKKIGKIIGKICLCILAVVVAFVGVTTIITVVTSKASLNKAMSFEQVQYKNQLVPEKDKDGNWCFTTDKKLKVLQLTDVHIGGGWMSAKKDGMTLNSVAAMVTAEKPDLVIVTGDIGYPVPFQAGTFNNKTSANIFATLMDSLGVYWTMAMGNHDTEAYSYFNRDEIGSMYENNYKYSLFQCGERVIDGAGNQVILVKNTKDIVTQALFTLDSGSYVDGDYLGIMWKYDGVHENQIKWYSDTLDAINAQNNIVYQKNGEKTKSDVKSLMFFHIPIVEMNDAWNAYAENGYKDTDNVKLIYGVAGETGKVVYSSMHDNSLFETVKEKGSTKGIFFGHDHKNNISFEIDGIRLTYGMSIDYLAYPGIYKLGSQRGCTVITVNPDGTFDYKPENYYQDKYRSQYEKETVEMQTVEYSEWTTEK